MIPLSFWWVLPFAGLLCSIAFVPMAAKDLWHKHHGKIAFFWAAIFLIPYGINFGFAHSVHDVAHVFFLEYLPFVILLTTLFGIAGGIHIGGRATPSPHLNTGFLGFGALIASWTGTTGASMLLIRPLLAINHKRRHRAHVVVFFIILVANIGGALTPLGDPPLFLGFLNGVDFFWTTRFMLAPMLLLSSIVLVIFWFVDRHYFALEQGIKDSEVVGDQKGRFFTISGIFNVVLLLGVVMAVLASGTLKYGTIHLIVDIPVAGLLRDGILLFLLYLSFKVTRPHIRELNHFDWFPMKEVAKLFAGIFITIIPAIMILRAWAPELQTMGADMPMAAMLFWMTGLLSSILDNAPTYLIFFNAMGGDANYLMREGAQLLLAISSGAVFMGALTYIGNAPNFMVRSIAEERGVVMPSFFAYMGYACLILFPSFALVTIIWFL